MKIRAVIYDFDGVINDSAHKGAERIIDIVQRFGHSIPPDIWEKFTGIWDTQGKQTQKGTWGLPGAIMIERAFNISQTESENIYEEWERIDAMDLLPLIKGAIETLSFLKRQGFVQLMLTSRNKENLIAVLNCHDIVPFFAVIQTRDTWSFRKPDPHTFCFILDYLEKQGVSIGECVYVGDTPEDFHAGNSRGVENVSVLSGLFTKKHFLTIGQKENYIIRSISELPNWLAWRNA